MFIRKYKNIKNEFFEKTKKNKKIKNEQNVLTYIFFVYII